MLKVSTPIHCVFAESKINIELGEGGSEINLLKMVPKIAKCPSNFGQDCSTIKLHNNCAVGKVTEFLLFYHYFINLIKTLPCRAVYSLYFRLGSCDTRRIATTKKERLNAHGSQMFL